MNDIGIKQLKIEDMIYEVRGHQVMLDSKTSVTKCHDNYYDSMTTHYDIVIPILVY